MKLLAALNKDKFFFSVVVLFKEVSFVERTHLREAHYKFSQW